MSDLVKESGLGSRANRVVPEPSANKDIRHVRIELLSLDIRLGSIEQNLANTRKALKQLIKDSR